MAEQDDTPELRLQIDRLRLDEEWSDQPKMFHNWSLQVADAQLTYDQAKAKLDVTCAELSDGMRKDPESFGLDKVTEKAIELAIPLQPDHQLAVNRVNKARHTLEVAKAAVNALEHRKRAMSLLVELFIRDYYSEATVKPRSEAGETYMKDQVRNRGRRRLEDQQDGGDTNDAD